MVHISKHLDCHRQVIENKDDYKVTLWLRATTMVVFGQETTFRGPAALSTGYSQGWSPMMIDYSALIFLWKSIEKSVDARTFQAHDGFSSRVHGTIAEGFSNGSGGGLARR
jgi:hypothetical protein